MLRTIALFLVCAGTALGSAQCTLSNPNARPYDDAITQIFTPPADGGGTEIRDLIDLEQSYTCFANYVLLRLTSTERARVFHLAFLDLRPALMAAASQKAQAGSSNSTGGSTNLVAKGTTAQILSMATEYGALTESQSNQTVTAQGTLDGPLLAATRNYLVGYCTSSTNVDPQCIDPRVHQILSYFSYGVTFNTSSTSQTTAGQTTAGQTTAGQTTGTPSASATAQQVTFTASGRQIASITGQFAWSPNGPSTSATVSKAWNCLFSNSGGGGGTGSGSTPTPAQTSVSGVKANFTASPAQASANGCSKLVVQGQTITDGNLLQALRVQSATLLKLLNTLNLPANPDKVMQLADTDPTKKFLRYYIGIWWNQTLMTLQEDKNAGNSTKFASDLYAALDDLTNHLAEPGTQLGDQVIQEAADLIRTSGLVRMENQILVDAVANSPVVSLQYADTRPQNANSYSTIKLIANKSFGKVSIALNGAVALNTRTYATVPGSKTYRDAQAGAEVKYSFGSLSVLGSSLGNAALAGTYYYQYQASPSVLNVTPGTPLTGITISGLPSVATQVFAQKGTISIGQLRLELGSGSNLKVPIAISYSNRTELITKPEFRAQIGLSYSFDSLFTSGGAAQMPMQ